MALGPNEYGETAQLYHREENHLDGPDGTLADVLEDLAEGLETGRYSLSDEELEAGEARPPLPPAPPLDPAVSEPSLADLRRELRSPETSPARLLELVQLSPENWGGWSRSVPARQSCWLHWAAASTC